jgi:hypothetical protein
MRFPETRELMHKAGHKRSNYSRCRGCNAAIEWWVMKSGSRMPMEPMPLPESKAISHWATCPCEKDFRKKKEPQPCRPDNLQLLLVSSAPPQPSVKNSEKKGSTNS